MTHYVRLNPNYPQQPQKWLIIDSATEEYVDYADTREEARKKSHDLTFQQKCSDYRLHNWN